MRIRMALTAFIGAGVAAATVALAVPASAAPSPAAAASRVSAAAAGCHPHASRPHLARGKARGDGSLTCAQTVTDIVLKVKLFRAGKLKAKTVVPKSSGTSVSGQASRTCSDTILGAFVTVTKAQYTFQGTRHTVTKTSTVVNLTCGF